MQGAADLESGPRRPRGKAEGRASRRLRLFRKAKAGRVIFGPTADPEGMCFLNGGSVDHGKDRRNF